MNDYHITRARRKSGVPELPLFEWANSRPLPSTNSPRVVAKLSQRFGLSIALAQTVAELAGLHTEIEHAYQ